MHIRYEKKKISDFKRDTLHRQRSHRNCLHNYPHIEARWN